MGSIGSRSCATPAVFDISIIALSNSFTLALHAHQQSNANKRLESIQENASYAFPEARPRTAKPNTCACMQSVSQSVVSRIRRSQVVVLANVILKIEKVCSVVLQASKHSVQLSQRSHDIPTGSISSGKLVRLVVVAAASLAVLTFLFCPIISFQSPRIIEAKIAPFLNGPPF